MISSKEAGMTLVEILIAMTILAFGILAVGAMQVTAIQGNSFSRRMTEASNVGQAQIETFLGLPFNDPQLTDGAHPAVDQNGYSVSWTVSEEATLPRTKDIVLEVGWQERGDDKRIILRYVKADHI